MQVHCALQGILHRLLPHQQAYLAPCFPSVPQVYNEQLRDLLADTAPGRREAGRIQGTGRVAVIG